MSLSARVTGPADAMIFDDADQVAEIRGLKLVSARFHPGERNLIGETFPLFLFWMQYANHQDPERNAGSGGRIEVVTQKPDQVVLRCNGTTASGACSGSVTLTIRRVEGPGRYVYTVHATLDVLSERGWLITPNPTQGEVEFANLWADGVFSPNPNDVKLYQACFLLTRTGAEKIPHHHLESSDKHHIVMHQGDRFLWLKEDANPCLTILTDKTVTAGLCAYMWDAHFAYKICTEGKEVLLPAGTHFEAGYELESIDALEAGRIIDRAVDRPAPETASIPLYVPGVNRFTTTLSDAGEDRRYVWPWESEGDAESTLTFDRKVGFDDSSSLRIHSRTQGRACWRLSTLGPAFGGKPFPDGCGYRLSAYVKTSKLSGKATVAVRFHRKDRGSVFDLQNYETVYSGRVLAGDREWESVVVIVPPVSPAPDRLHLLLIQEGSGTTWFDNVLFEVLT